MMLVGSDAVNAIAAGATSSETASVIINNAIAAGNYYLLYQADANGNIGESNSLGGSPSSDNTVRIRFFDDMP
ncbi:CARDB domain-containing protein [Nostoc sp. TCL240-02]|uniref:CARDB domain-containing protein n=1 Tax=Nostoc sp. TCL240-02 TaxID=2572090 RepID=UPI00157F8B5C|nr:CARDB domain-containing protein [Nostoc sp. TCL240-02]QKQ74356.1 hypothetical protein FBB35_14400 [Nostoc sp. TCL240-02]